MLLSLIGRAPGVTSHSNRICNRTPAFALALVASWAAAQALPLWSSCCGPLCADPNIRDLQGRSALHAALDFDEDFNGVDLEAAEVWLHIRHTPSRHSKLSQLYMVASLAHAL